MAKQKSTSKHQQGLYATYKAGEKWKVNRKKKLLRALKKNPGNAEEINKAIANMSYRRRIGKEANKTIPNDRGPRVVYEKTSERKMFQLRARAHDGRGNSIWTS